MGSSLIECYRYVSMFLILQKHADFILDLAPEYICELVVPYVPRRVLRSAELNLLTIPQGNLVNVDPEVLLEPQRIYGTP